MGVFARLLSIVGVNVAPALGNRPSGRDDRSSSHEDLSACPADASASRQQIAGQLAGGVAHDLNNLLATILGCLELMERRLGDPERLKALIKRSSDAVDRAASLTSRLAQVARRQPQPPLPTDINALVADLTPLVASTLGKRIRLFTELSPAPAFAQVDPAGLEMTLLAICLAARTAIPETGQISVITQVSEASLTVSVTATGPGLSHLGLDQARCIAAAAGVALQVGRVADGAEVIVLLSFAAEIADPSEARPVLAPRHDLGLGANAE